MTDPPVSPNQNEEDMNSFAHLNLNDKINRAIKHCGYERPTEIQAKTIPLILEGNDLVGATETGSGKTAAFVLPALQLLAETRLQKKPRILILTPTRELAHQITDAARKYGQFMKFTITSIIGGVSYGHQERMLANALDIIVATPGRLMDHMQKGRIDFSDIELFVLDEADRMLDMGFIADIKKIRTALPKDVQTLLFTATLDKKLDNIIRDLLNNPVNVNLSKPLLVPDQIAQQLFIANHNNEKISFLENLLQRKQIFKGIIFSATKSGADKLAHHLRDKGHKALALHGDLSQYTRKQSLEKLRNHKIQLLVATDVAARGLDIHDISHVINYDLPRCLEDYIHRVGRTGRAGRAGEAITIATKADRRQIIRIEQKVGQRLQHIDFDQTMISTPTFIHESEQKPKKRFGKSRRRKPAFRDQQNPNRSSRTDEKRAPRVAKKRRKASHTTTH